MQNDKKRRKEKASDVLNGGEVFPKYTREELASKLQIFIDNDSLAQDLLSVPQSSKPEKSFEELQSSIKEKWEKEVDFIERKEEEYSVTLCQILSLQKMKQQLHLKQKAEQVNVEEK